MKLTLFIMIAFCLHVNAGVIAQNVTLKVKDASLRQVFKSIKRQTNFTFFFDPVLLDKGNKVSITVEGEPVEKVLDLCFQNQPFIYSIEGRIITIEPLPAVTASPETNTSPLSRLLTDNLDTLITVRGRVLNEKNEPVIATVMVQKTNRGTATGEHGYFEFQNIEENATLIISAANIETATFKINKRTQFTITVKTALADLNQVVVSKGFYTERQRLSTGNVTRVDGKDIERQPVSNPLVALQGRVPGLEVIAPSGAPGSAPQVRIRGQNSLNRSAGLPLYVIDGVIIQSNSLRTNSNAYTNSSGSSIYEYSGIDPLITMNPANIESIDILKDADATAIYGSLGANGVIIITTKRSKNAEKLSIDLNITKGVTRMTDRFPVLNTKQYIEMRKEAYANAGEVPGKYDFPLTVWDPERNVNWQDELLSKSAQYENVQFGFWGGRNNTSFRFNGAYENKGAIIPGNFKTERFNGGFDLNHRSTDDRFTFGFTTNYGHVAANQVSANNLVNAAFQLPPNAPELYAENGSINWGVMHIGGGEMFPTFSDNPVAALLNTTISTMRTFTARTRVGYKILSGLSFATNLGFSNTVTDENNKFPMATIPPQFLGVGSTGRSDFTTNKRDNLDLFSTLSYTRTFNEHHSLDFDAGVQLMTSNSNVKNASAEGYQSDMLLGSLASATRWRFNMDEIVQYRYLGFFGRVGYRYKDKYLFNLTGRRDGSSRFGPGKQFGNFGAIAAAWIFSEEPWLKNSNLLSFGKLRGSYGIVGSDNVGNYMFYKLWRVGSYTYHDNTTLLPFNLDNPDYQWEQTTKLEIALDLSFFKDRLNFSGSYFKHRTGNQLVSYQLPSTTGFPSITQNLDAIVQNTGLELSLMSRNISTKNFSWITSLNVTLQRNKLIAFPGIEESPYASTFRVGKSLSVPNWYTWEGMDPLTGRFRFKDINNDGEIDYRDMTLEHDLQTGFLGGLINTFRYKSFELGVQLYFTRRNSTSQIYPYYPGGGSNNLYAGAMQRWQKPGDITAVPKFTVNSNDQEGFYQSLQSNYVLQDASYIRLSNLTFSYSFQGKALKATRLAALKLFVDAQNLLIITGYTGMDPESGVIAMPQPKIITGGFRLTI